VTRIWADPERFVDDAVAGFCDVYRDLVRAVPGGVVRATATPPGKVAVVTGGGSGHYPAFAGYVGPGLADGAVVGNVFASPSAAQVHDVAVTAQRGAGVLLTFGNYAGDVLNFSLAAERLRAEGVPTEVLPVADDIASAPADRTSDRRGVAGGVVVYKIAGAAAEAGRDLAEVLRLARLANDRTRSFGVAYAGCTLPGSAEPLFTVADGRIGVGLGVHGEPGIDEVEQLPADELAELLVARLAGEAPDGAPGRVVALLNGLGATKYEELFVLWHHVAEALGRHGLEVVDREAGELVTSLDMAGCSLTLAFLDDETLELWRAPAQTPAYRRGAVTAAPADANQPVATRADVRYAEAGPESAAAAAALVRLLGTLHESLAEAEPALAELDTVAGDGDHGRAMRLGAEHAHRAASAAAEAGAGLASTLTAAADAWPDGAGGASGALWGVGLRAAGGVLDDRSGASAGRVAEAVQAALEAVVARGGAQPGDKTLVDALDPFARTLRERVASGAPLAEAWRAAAEAATTAAEATAPLRPRLGRARPLAERSLGHPDAGAVSLARAATGVAAAADTSR
jgi:dihydroxyacetone kinase